MSTMVLFLVFLQKGSFVAYMGSTIVRAIFRQAQDQKSLVQLISNNNNNKNIEEGSDNDEPDLILR